MLQAMRAELVQPRPLIAFAVSRQAGLDFVDDRTDFTPAQPFLLCRQPVLPLRAGQVHALRDLAEVFNGVPEVDEFQNLLGLEPQGFDQLRNPSPDPGGSIGDEEDASGGSDSEAHEKGLEHLEETGAQGRIARPMALPRVSPG